MSQSTRTTGAVARLLITRLALVGILLSLTVTSIQLFNDYRHGVDRLVVELDRIETSHLPSLVENAWLDDRERLTTLLEGLMHRPAFAQASIKGPDGQVLVQRGVAARNPMTRTYALSRPYGGKIIDLGTLTIVTDLAVLRDDALMLLLSGVIWNAVLLLCLSVLLYLQVHKVVTSRLEAIAEQAALLGRLGPSQTPPLDMGENPPQDELTDLVRGLNRMQEELAAANRDVAVSAERYRELFSRSPVSLWEEDFSAVKDAIASLSTDIEDFPAFLEANPAFVRECASKVRIIAVNQASVAMHRARSATELCDRLQAIFTPASFDGFARQLQAIWQGDADLAVTSEVRTLEGDIRDVVIRWHVPPQHRDRYDRVIVSQEDITDIKSAHRSAEITMEKLMQAKAELERFTFVASHDLREPIRSIISFSQLLERSLGSKAQIPPDVAECLDYLKSAALRMQDQVSGLYEYSRAGQPPESFQTVDLSLPLADAQAVLAETIRAKGATITATDLPSVSGYRPQLAELFRHLLDNSLKFHRPDAPPTIHVEATQVGDFWQITVADNGIGIDPLYVVSIFDVFRRLHGPGQYAGAGLGLSICRRIVETHGGHISIDTTRTDGTSVVILLPAALASSRAAQ